MRDEAKDRWMLLCNQASTEQNPEKLLALIQEINQLLEEKRSRISAQSEREPRAEEPPEVKANN
jgi:hypothetical protein